MRLLLALLLIALPRPALAWWEYGHETVAKIAWANVRPATRAQIRVLLARSDTLATPGCAARTIEAASVWPDCIKPLKGPDGTPRFGYAYGWHFQDVDICAPFALPPECADGNCVSAAISTQAKSLGDRRLPRVDRLRALAFLVHFVGDLHQPLHAGEHGDQGGNKVAAIYGTAGGKRMNLHGIWDGYLAERAISAPPGGARGIMAGIGAKQRRALGRGTVLDWSRESWAVSKTFAYGAVMGDPCGPPSGIVTFDEAHIRALEPVVRLQITRAGLRLARLLDRALR